MKRLYYILFVLMLPPMAVAQNALSLSDCISLAKKNNKKIVAADFHVKAAHYDRQAAQGNFLPKLALTSTGLYSTADGKLEIEGGTLPVLGTDGKPTGAGAYFPGIEIDYKIDRVYGTAIQLQQPIFMGGKIVAGYKMSKIAEFIALQHRRQTEAEVIVETTKAYANVVKATGMMRVARAYNEMLKELKHSVEKAYERGATPRNDVLRVDVKLNESELALHRAENARRLAMMSLCHRVGEPLDANIDVKSELPEVDCTGGATDVSSRPEAQMLAGKSELMLLNVKMVRAEQLPEIGLMGQYGCMYGVKLGEKNLFKGWNFAAGVQFTVPIPNVSTYSKLRSAKMLYNEAEAERDEAMELITLEAAQAANNLDEAAMELSLAERSVEAAAENMRVTGSRYKVGSESLADYLEAQALWMQAEQTLVDARVNRLLRQMELYKATGRLL